MLNFDEPFTRLLTQGMVQGKTYKNSRTGKYVIPANVKDSSDPRDPETGDVLDIVYEKMSKSKYNGIAPEEVLGKYGADTARMFILFKAPPEKDLEWDEADVEGQFRFLNRVWRLVSEYAAKRRSSGQAQFSKGQPNRGQLTKPEKDLRYAIHYAIQEITDDLESNYQFNTAVSELMKLSNAISDAPCKDSAVYAEAIETLLRLLAPFAPHMTEELWHLLGHSDSVHYQGWSTADPSALVVDEIPLVIQIMGKTRGTIQVSAQATKAEQEQYARESELAQKYIAGKEIKKVIVVPGKLVNFVIS